MKRRTQRSCRNSPRHRQPAVRRTQGLPAQDGRAELGAAGFDSSQISGGGLKVTTTFDKMPRPRRGVSARNSPSSRPGRRQKAPAACRDSFGRCEHGEVIALYGGPTSSRTPATGPPHHARLRQPSRPTPAAGLKDGFSLFDTFNGNTWTPPGDKNPVRNEFSHQYGQSVT
jgi:hypothetical protein